MKRTKKKLNSLDYNEEGNWTEQMSHGILGVMHRYSWIAAEA
ncbi:hypothetical protein CDL12_12382 [Handroanthus impetiginosus]|uniref:Uncharacterized protein n=1 Tax=Handroanthus impetiginosus TaxID=429701 RepID=A0A2G9HBT3_9LAMI|nr:hypothetical protein CDL12_12382 [Handroanthus impetiginosus]